MTCGRTAISERVAGNGHGHQHDCDFGPAFAVAASWLAAWAGWMRVIHPSNTFKTALVAAAALFCAYQGIQRLVLRRLNWLELRPKFITVPKTEIDGFVTLSSLLTTAAGLSLLNPANPALVGVLVAGNLLWGLLIIDASRRLRREEVSTKSVTQNVVNQHIYAAMRRLLLWQIRFLLLAIVALVLSRLGDP
jgi:hypothetical protein